VAGFIPARKGLDAEGGKKEVEKLGSYEVGNDAIAGCGAIVRALSKAHYGWNLVL